MSESDLYRKQRTAVAEVARTLAEMEAVAAREEGQPVEPAAPRAACEGRFLYNPRFCGIIAA